MVSAWGRIRASAARSEENLGEIQSLAAGVHGSAAKHAADAQMRLPQRILEGGGTTGRAVECGDAGEERGDVVRRRAVKRRCEDAGRGCAEWHGHAERGTAYRRLRREGGERETRRFSALGQIRRGRWRFDGQWRVSARGSDARLEIYTACAQIFHFPTPPRVSANAYKYSQFTAWTDHEAVDS